MLAAGAVLWRAGARGPEVALVHRPRYDDWSFPKGKLDAGEAMPFAAAREVAEETGHRCRLGALLGDVQYRVAEGTKLVRYWAAEAGAGAFTPNHETDELRWVDPGVAAELLSYPHDRSLLHRFTELAPPRSVVLLVRHAKAGSRQQWDGDGRAAPAVRDRPGAGPAPGRTAAAVRSGPAVQRAAACAAGRPSSRWPSGSGSPVVDEPLLGEDDYWADPAAGLDRLRELAEQPGVTVLSSQGGVIPDLVRALVGEHPIDGLDPDDVPSRKASTWVLTFAASGLRSADYYPHPGGG